MGEGRLDPLMTSFMNGALLYGLYTDSLGWAKVLFFYTVFIRVFGKFIYGLITRQWNLVNFSLGAISAVVEIAKFEFGLSVKDDIRED